MATYACGDLHGFMEIYKKIKSMLKPEDKVIFLGDAGDRGPESWECIKAIYEDPQFIYLKGNHEDMLVRAAKDYIRHGLWMRNTARLCEHNGGRDAMEGWLNEPDKEEWLYKLDNLPVSYEYISENNKFLLTHAGLTPWLDEEEYEEVIDMPWDYDLMWDRNHYFDTWIPHKVADIIIVHGHTPIHYLAEDLRKRWDHGAFWYSDNHKVCLDSGGFFYGEWVLLNLDTLEDIVIELDGNDQMCF
jgi:serine/threonine protein phosphatase 1